MADLREIGMQASLVEHGRVRRATGERRGPGAPPALAGRTGCVAVGTRRRIEELLREHRYRRPAMVASSPGVEVVFYHLQSDLAVEIMRGVQEVVGHHDLSVGF